MVKTAGDGEVAESLLSLLVSVSSLSKLELVSEVVTRAGTLFTLSFPCSPPPSAEVPRVALAWLLPRLELRFSQPPTPSPSTEQLRED